MNKNDKWQNNKDFSRAGDVKVTTDQRTTLGDLAIAHYASGNDDMFKLGINTLTKLDTQAAIDNRFAAIEAMITKIADK